MRLWIALFSLLALAACANAQQSGGDISFAGMTSSAPAESGGSACSDAAFPGSAPLDSERDGAVSFFCDH